MDGSEDRMIPAVFRNTSMAHRGSSGQRISRAETKLTEGPGGETAETTRTGYYYQDGAVLYTRDADGRRSSMNLLGTSANIIATSRGTGDSESWYLYNKDIRESTTSLTAADGSAAATYEYDDFGGTTVTSGADLDNEICYTGQIYDQSSGLYYYNARFYDPENARFLTQDTYRGENEQPDTLHLYAYCANNPINYVDPSGHDFIYLTARAGAAGFGHAALLIKYKNKWRYFSWEAKGYRSKHARLKVVKKGIKGKKVYKSINKAKNVKRPKNKPYNRYFYIKAKSRPAYKYAKEIRAGKHYKSYSLGAYNCAWVAIDILKHGKIGGKKRKKLNSLLYTYVKPGWYKYKKMRTIIPNNVDSKVAKVFGTKVKQVK